MSPGCPTNCVSNHGCSVLRNNSFARYTPRPEPVKPQRSVPRILVLPSPPLHLALANMFFDSFRREALQRRRRRPRPSSTSALLHIVVRRRSTSFDANRRPAQKFRDRPSVEHTEQPSGPSDPAKEHESARTQSIQRGMNRPQENNSQIPSVPMRSLMRICSSSFPRKKVILRSVTLTPLSESRMRVAKCLRML